MWFEHIAFTYDNFEIIEPPTKTLSKGTRIIANNSQADLDLYGD